MITVNGAANGDWEVIDADGNILAVEKTNVAAWRTVERLEVRAAGRKANLYQSENATTIAKDLK